MRRCEPSTWNNAPSWKMHLASLLCCPCLVRATLGLWGLRAGALCCPGHVIWDMRPSCVSCFRVSLCSLVDQTEVVINSCYLGTSRKLTKYHPRGCVISHKDQLLYSKGLTTLDSELKSKDITLQTKVSIVKAMVFPVVTYSCESWTIKKAEWGRVDALQTVVLKKTPESLGLQGDQTSQS